METDSLNWWKRMLPLRGELEGALDYLFPRYCPICNRRLVRTEHSVCTSCLLSLPRIAYHGEGEDEASLAATDETSSQGRGMAQHGVIERHFWGKVPIERAKSGFR